MNNLNKLKIISNKDIIGNVIDESHLKQWFGKSKIVDKNGKPMVVYHGSSSYFEQFDIGMIGNKHGTGSGHGFYFTDSYELAKGYAEGNSANVMHIYLKIEQPMTLTQRKINRAKFKEILMELYKKDKEALSNYGDVPYDGINNVLNEALDSIMGGSDNDVDIIHDILNSGTGSYRDVFTILKKVTGYDGIITKAGSDTVYVVFLPEQVAQIKNDKINL
jgi:hypothetical protein